MRQLLRGDDMKIRIHWITKDGFEDNIIIEADTLDELREIAKREVEKRNAVDYWSSEL